jgi:hypothetical protein
MGRPFFCFNFRRPLRWRRCGSLCCSESRQSRRFVADERALRTSPQELVFGIHCLLTQAYKNQALHFDVEPTENISRKRACPNRNRRGVFAWVQNTALSYGFCGIQRVRGLCDYRASRRPLRNRARCARKRRVALPSRSTLLATPSSGMGNGVTNGAGFYSPHSPDNGGTLSNFLQIRFILPP